MNSQGEGAGGARNRTSVARKGDRELVVTRIFDAPPSVVYKAWSQPALFRQWWMPKSASGVTLVACDMDVRTGGTYRLEFSTGGSETMAFYGKYLDVIPDARIVWTNDEGEGGEGGEEGAITTVTFEAQGGKTLLTFHEIYPTREALEDALQGSAAGLPEQLDQLDALLAGDGA
jgi:uncharacterized protein YndB with AHSA1/START domain